MASSERSTRPPSIGNAGSRLNSTRNTFTASKRSANEPVVVLMEPSAVHEPVSVIHAAKMAAMTTFTAGPATAIQNSCTGLSGIRSNRARPPMGRSVMSRVPMP